MCCADAAKTTTALTRDGLKQLAAVRAVKQVENGMVQGLLMGSMAAFVVAGIAPRSSAYPPHRERTYEQALSLGIPLSTLDDHPFVDLANDDVDEVLVVDVALAGATSTPTPQLACLARASNPRQIGRAHV